MAYATLEDAIELATDKFRGVTDKAGQPYVLHLLRVMLRQSEAAAQQVAVLHDLIEDTPVSLEDLRRLNYAPEVVAAVDALTHREEQSYAQYVLQLAGNAWARQVKLADLEDNYRLDRVAFREGSEQEDGRRIARYILSHQFLTQQIREPEYVRRMAQLDQAD
jgi:hypothetical protein